MNKGSLIAAVTLAALVGCSKEPAAPPAPTAADADAFVASINAELRQKLPLANSASWLQSTYITEDSQKIAAKFGEEFLNLRARWLQEAKKFQGIEGLSPETARALALLKNTNTPPPSDPAKPQGRRRQRALPHAAGGREGPHQRQARPAARRDRRGLGRLARDRQADP
jgi:peptidyl-dipeptidase A